MKKVVKKAGGKLGEKIADWIEGIEGGIGEFGEGDRDNNGVADFLDDWDNDGIPNWKDDSDNDGITDDSDRDMIEANEKEDRKKGK